MCRLLLPAFLLWGSDAFSQELSYKQYTIREGLPGSVVYQALQDKQGFIWFATNQGVGRFDGSIFKHFTKEDGLPDDDVIKLYSDRYNNIWFLTLSGIPAVYHKGKISRMDAKGIIAMAEDPLNDSIYLISILNEKYISAYGYYRSLNAPGNWHFSGVFREAFDNKPVENWPILRASLPDGIAWYFSYVDGHVNRITIKAAASERSFLFTNKGNSSGLFPFTPYAFFYPLTNKRGIVFASADSLYFTDRQQLQGLLSMQSLGLNLQRDDDVSSLFCENDTTLWLCTRNKGVIRIAHFMRADRTVQYFFPDVFCTSIVKDKEEGYWITTLNNGVYYLPNQDFYQLNNTAALTGKEIKCIRQLDDERLGIGLANGTIATINHNTLQVNVLTEWTASQKNNRIMDIWPWRGGLLVGSDKGMFSVQQHAWQPLQFHGLSGIGAIKGLALETDTSAFIGYASGALLMNLHTGTGKRLFPSRTTCVAATRNKYFLGTLNGLYEYGHDSAVALGSRYPALSGIINHIDIAPDSSLWISTQEGIVIYKNAVVQVIKKEQGLLSNTCRHVLFSDHTAWASTDKGISRINYQWRGNEVHYSISGITEEDGLISNDVNQTAAAGKYIWAATNKGISYFSKAYISQSWSPPQIYINRMQVGSKNVPVDDTVMVTYPDNNLLIELSAISFRSGKNVYYEHRLQGLDTTWRRTINNVVEYAALPFGQLTFEIRAINRWGETTIYPGQIIIINKPPFWKTTWFLAIVYVLSLFVLSVGFYLFYRNRQHKKEQVFLVNKKINDLEMLALRSQMNPHFIFNCLSSIQRYILKADIVNANLYLHKFSTLIRKILHYSNTSTISLTEEIAILGLYLSLEKLRMGDKMDYQIVLPEDLRLDNLYIPCMIIQPYVENAVKHGVSPLFNRKGMVTVRFERSAAYIECFVEDNGPGIMASLANKSSDSPEYPSMGTSITENRIQAMNSIQPDKIVLKVTDKSQLDPLTTGTIIQLSFPIITD